jgi:predicted glycosyltransferase
MIFNDVAAQEHLDLVIADGAWQVDYHLHENPELKRFAYAWLTDVIGWLPMGEGDSREASLVADANTEMLQQVERYPRIRDRALYLGNPADLPAASFGAGLPSIREWARKHFSFTGAVAGFEPADLADQASLRNELGYRREEQICIVTAGGTTMGEALLRRAIEAFSIARLRLPALRMVVVAGPRLDPAALPQPDGLEVRGYVPGLHRFLAASDVAVVHGGRATTMELLAARRPFVWFPLRRDFEQRCHVTHRLKRYRAGRPTEYAATSAEALADAIVDLIGSEVHFRPVAGGGAARAASLLATLL